VPYFFATKGQSFLTKRWFIYKKDKPTGPYSALEIRQLLREGVVDPFDYVSREGSQLKIELVEVDEIFSNENISYDSQSQAASGDQAFVPQIADRSYSDKRKSVPYDSSSPSVGSTTPRSNPGQHLALASDLRKIGSSGNLPVPISEAYSASKKKRRDPKRYHLIDPKGRVLGPLSPGEIQSLYYRGVVEKSVKVMRDGSNSAVPVAKFVSAYAEAQGVPKIPKQGGHPNIQGVSNSALNRLAMMRRAQAVPGRVQGRLPLLAIGIFVVAILLIGLTVGLLIHDGTLFDGFRDNPTSEQPKPRVVSKKAQQKPKVVTKKAETKKAAIKKTAPQKAVDRISPGRGGTGVLARPPSSKVRPSVQKHTIPAVKSQPSNSRGTPNASPRFKQPVKKPPVVYRQPVKKAVKPFGPVTTPPKAAPPAKPSGPTVGSLVNGQAVVGLGPMQYSREAVKACDGACTVVFTGAGGSVSVAFFKNVWGESLMAKQGGVYISGLVRKSGGSTAIMLSGVR